eukprot:TRINITY_DN3601_c0_g1_i1.p1 TRINITY_DN3601_c0_g1~~TRINITY_DN3601_c0_g1_i1.p1  ORF type:complete len:124 (+),score=21.42 TRINITY_DN3601_c0_g1_i1:90-461(+)
MSESHETLQDFLDHVYRPPGRSKYLLSTWRSLAENCQPQSVEFLKCKNESRNCYDAAQTLVSCFEKTLDSATKSCSKPLDEHAICLNTHRTRFEKCRTTEAVLHECLHQNGLQKKSPLFNTQV